MQAAYAEEIREYFDPVPVARLPLFSEEVIGWQRLQEVAQALYGDEDPTARYVTAPPYDFVKDGNHYRLEITLPFVHKEDIDLQRQPEDLVIRVGSFKRHVPLPRTVVRLKTAGAKMDGPRLVVRFTEEGSP